MKKSALISSLLLCVSLLTACGQRGPLYLPEKKSPMPQQPTPATATPENSQVGE